MTFTVIKDLYSFFTRQLLSRLRNVQTLTLVVWLMIVNYYKAKDQDFIFSCGDTEVKSCLYFCWIWEFIATFTFTFFPP